MNDKAAMIKRRETVEPDMKTALSWYPEMKNQYVPIGWKNSLFEALLMWNGDIVIPTNIYQDQGFEKKGLEKYYKSDVQFNFYWDVEGRCSCAGDKYFDNSAVVRSYLDGWKPVAVINQFLHGMSIEERVFSHAPGGCELVAGDNPMFVWVDFNIQKVVDILTIEKEITLHIEVIGHALINNMEAGYNSFNKDKYPLYAHTLKYEQGMLVQDDGMVRMMVDNNSDSELSFHDTWTHMHWPPKSHNNVMSIKVPIVSGHAGIRLLIPILPVTRQEMMEEASRGFNTCLDETLLFWEKQYENGIKIKVPEKLIENTFMSNPWRTLVIAEQNPVFDEYCLNNGAFSYDCLWPTPSCLTNVWGLDYMGYHSDAARYLEVYRHDQGNVMPPGVHYIQHPGFLSTPEKFVAVRWVNEHGAIMWAVCEHFLLTRDVEFLNKWLPSLLDACEWIYVQRRNIAHPGIKGILPPGKASDDSILGHFVWNDGWMYKGLTSVARVLEEINHPDASKWRLEGKNYKSRFNEIYMDICSKSPIWKTESGEEYHFIPNELSGNMWEVHRHAFYLDAGPLFLAFSGLVDVDNPVFDSLLKWFREGPHVKYWRFDGCCWQMPVLHHEMSSCEPCYSWNMDINFLRNDREHFLEGLYAQLAGARTTDLFSDVETRNGMFATNFTTPVTFRHFRNALVYENDRSLELLKMIPDAWIKPGDILELENAPTYFGPLSLSLACDEHGEKLEINIDIPYRNQVDYISLFIPKYLAVTAAMIDGAPVQINCGKIDLTGITGHVRISLIYGDEHQQD